MAEVSGKSDLIVDTFDYTAEPPDPQQAKGRVVLATGTVENAADDSSGSKFELARIPADALVHEDSFFDVAAWGFDQIVIGTETDTDALVNQTKVTENIVTPFAIGDANHGKRWWEVLGLAESPGGTISIWAHAAAAAAAAGTMDFRIVYVTG